MPGNQFGSHSISCTFHEKEMEDNNWIFFYLSIFNNRISSASTRTYITDTPTYPQQPRNFLISIPTSHVAHTSTSNSNSNGSNSNKI